MEYVIIRNNEIVEYEGSFTNAYETEKYDIRQNEEDGIVALCVVNADKHTLTVSKEAFFVDGEMIKENDYAKLITLG